MLARHLVLTRAVECHTFGPGRRFIRTCCAIACWGWTLIAFAQPAMWPLAASAWVGWWILATKLKVA